MPTCRLVDFDSKNLAFQPLRSNEGGKGKTAYINVRGGENLFQCPRVRMPFALKPGMGETTVKVSRLAREHAFAPPLTPPPTAVHEDEARVHDQPRRYGAGSCH